MNDNRPSVWNALVFPEFHRDAYRVLPTNQKAANCELGQSLVNFAASVLSNKPSNTQRLSVEEIWKDFHQNGQTTGEVPSPEPAIKVTSVILNKLGAKKLQFLPTLHTLAKKIRRDKKIREIHANYQGCVFCKNNNEPPEMVRSHQVRDIGTGKVTCPILRAFKCPICGGTGDQAHTLKYCPQKPIITMRDTELAERYNRACLDQYTLCQ